MKIADATLAINAFQQALRQDVVTPDVVAFRARICAAPCAARTPSVLAGVIASALKNTPKELANYKCGICKCPLGLLVPSKEPHQDSEKERARRMKINPNCWMLKL